MQLVFNRPAADLTDTLPVGNGRLGALIYGEMMREQVVLNENSMWSGSPEETDRQDAALYLPEIRRLLAEGKNYEAEQLFAEHFTCLGAGSNYAHGSTVPFGCYQILGRLHLSYFQALSDGRQDCCCASDYRRELDIMTGTACVSFRLGGTDFQRTWIVSEKEEAIYLHLTASRPGMIHVGIGLDRDEHFTTEVLDDHSLCMCGQLPDGFGGRNGIRYACVAGVKAIGGEVRAEGSRLYVRNGDEVLIAITARTDMQGNVLDAISENEKALAMSWQQIYTVHCQEMYRALGSMTLSFGDSEEGRRLAFYVMYGRYLLHCSSRRGGLPANLQGIWADEIQTPWNGDWHLNAQQMIYWLAEKGGLSDDHLPYLELTKQLVVPGRKTARAYYGARGWLVHTCTNPWGFTSPLENAAWGSTTGSPAWLCHHLWEHYLYTGDKDYLLEVWPVMKEAAEFYMDMLVEEPVHGWLVTSPSSSPENSFLDEQGRSCALCEGPAYDRELIAALFEYCMEAQYVLKQDPDFSEALKAYQTRLAPVQISSDGRIMEWDREYPEAMIHHRHLSHLWGVYPGQLITAEHTPKLAAAAEKSLRMRGRTTVGWAIAHRMCLWARLRRGEEVYGCIQDMFRYATGKNYMNLAYHCDETEQNPEEPDLENCRYPFQIDGNEGNAAGILLMLEDDFACVRPDGTMMVEIILLPALPKALPEGRVQGLCAKGGIMLDIEWQNGELTQALLSGKAGMQCLLRYGEKEKKVILGEKELSVDAAFFE